MKKLSLIFLSFLLYSCASAQVEQKPLYQVVGEVGAITPDVTILYTENRKVSYSIPTSDSLVIHNRYLFLLEIISCGNCPTRKAVVVDFSIVPAQAQTNMNGMVKKYSNRKIIK